MFVGRTDPRLAAELYLALQKPFALSCLDVEPAAHRLLAGRPPAEPVVAAEIDREFRAEHHLGPRLSGIRCKVYTAMKRPLAAAAARDLEEFDRRAAHEAGRE